MPSRKDLVEAQAYERGRVVAALVRGADGVGGEPDRPGRLLVAGLALAVLMVAGLAAAGLVLGGE